MSNQNAKLSRLPVNKTVVFYSPIEGKDVFVRTGMTGEGNSFIGSLLYACQKDYMFKTDKEKMKAVNKVYTKVCLRKWESLPVDREIFYTEMCGVLTEFYNKKDEENEIHSTLCELVSLENFADVILPSAMDKSDGKVMKKVKESIVEETTNFTFVILEKFGDSLDSERKEFFMKKMTEMITKILTEVENKLFKQFLKKDFTLDTETLKMISSKINRDIYFFNGDNRLPYKVIKENILKGRNSVFVMCVEGNHYEVVGKLLPGNKIQRQFERNDGIVKRVKSFLYHPDIIEDHYPHLVPYLEKEESYHSESRSESRSGSRSRSESDSRSRSQSRSRSRSESRSRSQSRSESEESRNEPRSRLKKSARKTRHRR